MKGLIFDMQRYSIHDGPGIRTVVFMKGCPLHCLYCCNPESQLASPEIEFWSNLCQHCGRCLTACPNAAINPDLSLAEGLKINRERCNGCALCAEVCPAGALRVIGKWCSVDEAMAQVLRDATFYRRSGGGVTLSGGEPMAQPDFATALLRLCHEHNIHTALETCGYVDWSVYEELAPYTDLFLYDIKHTESQAHRTLTGASNERILENLHRLAGSGAQIILRLPLIPGFNLDETHLHAVADLAVSLRVAEVHLMPFHHLARDKYRHLERTYELEGLPSLRETAEGQRSIHKAEAIIAQRGVAVFVGG